MKPIHLPLTSGGNNPDTDITDGSYLENWYAQAVPPNKKTPVVLLPTWGTVDFSTLSGIPLAGICLQRKLYITTTTNLYEVDNLGVGTDLGSVSFSADRVSMAENGEHLVVVGREGYTYSVADGLVQYQVSDNYLPSEFVEFLDGYFIFLRADTENIFISQLNSIVLDGTEIATEESEPDRLLSMTVVNRELWLFGAKSTAQWYNAEGFDFPFLRKQGPYIETGIIAKYSVASHKNNCAWIGEDRIIYKSRGSGSEPISDKDVEASISKGTILDAFAFMYTGDGHVFYQVTFPSLNLTWVYDFITGQWHNRSHSVHGRHFANFYIQAHGIDIIGDFQTPKLYEWTVDAKKDIDEFIHRELIAPVLHNDRKWFTLPVIAVDMKTGVGLTSGQGSDPQAFISISKDNKNTFTNPKSIDIGKIGEVTTRVRARRFGRMLQAHIKIVCNDAVDLVIAGLYR